MVKAKPKRAARKRAPKKAAAAAKPRPTRRRTAKPKGGEGNGVATALERASEQVREAVQADAPDEAA